MKQINTLVELSNALTAAIGNTVDSTIHVYPTRAGLQSIHVVLAIDQLYPAPDAGYLLNKKLLRDNMDAFASVEPGFDVLHGVFLEFSAVVVAELQRRDAEARIVKLNALMGILTPAASKNDTHLQWAFNGLGL